MLVVISPAKKLDWTACDVETTTPAFLSDANALAGTARGLTQSDLEKLMHISPDLARLNVERFRDFSDAPDGDEPRPAALAFAGDTYQGLEAASLDPDEMSYAQNHLRILSGLYGVLRPLDAIQPYRLEMGSRMKNPRGKSLYDYWGDTIAKALNEQGEAMGSDTLINCASQEHFGAVDLDALRLRLITPAFMEEKNGTPKIVSFYAKKARGAMTRYIVQNRLTDPASLRDFDAGGYAFSAELSSPDKPVFVRPSVT